MMGLSVAQSCLAFQIVMNVVDTAENCELLSQKAPS